MNKKINLETYDVDETQDQRGEEILLDTEEVVNNKKEGFLKRFWKSTVFPDMIRRKREEKQLRREIQEQARKEALVEMKDDLKQLYIQKEKDKITGKSRKDFLEKLAKGFESSTVGSTDKLNMMLKNDERSYSPAPKRPMTVKQDKRPMTVEKNDLASTYDTSNERISDLMGVGQSSKNSPRDKAVKSREDRIRRMMK